MTESPDLERLQQEYQNRRLSYAGSDIYSHFHRPNLFMIQGREQVILNALEKHAHKQIEKDRILEVGCGSGGVLKQFIAWGAPEKHLFGVDLLSDRLIEAKSKLSMLSVVNANGEWLPFPEGYFDLILQFTAFSSILDSQVKARVAQEMLRVLQPDGLILWYDFWLNPTNKQTKGIRPAEIRALFPGCKFDLHKITLAPPISRRIVHFSWVFAYILESVRLFNSHYLALIYKE